MSTLRYCLVFLILPGCIKVQELPAQIWINDSFTESERQIIFSAIERWELTTRIDIFDVQGFFSGEFSYDESVGDGKNVMYNFDRPTEESIRIEDGELKFGSTIEQEDIVLYTYHLDLSNLSDEEIREFYNLNREEMEEIFRIKLEHTVIHELGHFLGLEHNFLSECQSIMSVSPQSDFTSNCQWNISEHDIDEFCSLYDC